MNVLFLSIGRLDSITAHGIYIDLIREFRDNGHKVYVMAPRERRMNLPTEYSIEHGVHFLRIKTGNLTKTNLIEKGLSTVMLEQQLISGLRLHLNTVKFDLIIYSTPPVTFSKVVNFVRKRDGAKSYLLLKDIFPQNAVDLGIFSKRNPIYKYFRRKEENLYRLSDFIGCMSQANVDYLLAHNPSIPKGIVEVCPNAIEPRVILLDVETKRQIREKYGIPNQKTIFVYGGNLGKPQGIDFLIQCIKGNEKNRDSFILVVGSGTEFNKLKTYFNDSEPANSMLLNHLPKDEYELLATSCDVGLIFLDRKFTIPNFPSRLLSYMQASIPVMAATDLNTDLGSVITEGNFGFWCESGNSIEFNEMITKLCNEKLRTEMGANARNYLEIHFNVKLSYEIIMRHFN